MYSHENFVQATWYTKNVWSLSADEIILIPLIPKRWTWNIQSYKKDVKKD